MDSIAVDYSRADGAPQVHVELTRRGEKFLLKAAYSQDPEPKEREWEIAPAEALPIFEAIAGVRISFEGTAAEPGGAWLSGSTAISFCGGMSSSSFHWTVMEPVPHGWEALERIAEAVLALRRKYDSGYI